ncbi:MAG: sugar transferase [Actinomycetota bacterium]|nr:sugar transferase [Actinomycetota bacterium]
MAKSARRVVAERRAPQPDHGLAPSAGDIRSARPYLLSSGPVLSLARRAASVVALVVLDVSALTLGVYAALTLRELWYGRTPPLWGVLWRYEGDWLPFLALVTVLVFWQAGLYARREQRAGAGRIVGSVVVVALLTVAFGVGTGELDFSTYGFFPTAVVLTATLTGLLRASYEAATGELMRLWGVRRRTVLVGRAETVAQLRRALGASRGGIEYEFVGAVTDAPDIDGLRVLGTLETLPAVVATSGLDEMIVADSDFAEEELLEIVDRAHRRGVKVRIAPKTTELLTERAEYVPSQGVPLFELRPPVFAGTDWLVKRTFDLVVSGAVIAVGLPLWLLIASAIKLTSPGPVFYRDRRVGLNHRQFTMLKFRTMEHGADERQLELEARNEADGPLFKIRDDPRVTRLGAVLRRLSLDELPQVLNVVRGEMSLVGPRPLRLRDYARLEEWHRKRNLVLPGMTGLWQISGRSTLPFDDLVRLDFYYLENWSLWMDITILVKTIPAVLRARGAY